MNKKIYKYSIFIRAIGNIISLLIISVASVATVLLSKLVYIIIFNNNILGNWGIYVSFLMCFFAIFFSFWQITSYPDIKTDEKYFYFRRIFLWQHIEWKDMIKIRMYDTRGWNLPLPHKGKIMLITTNSKNLYKKYIFVTNAISNCEELADIIECHYNKKSASFTTEETNYDPVVHKKEFVNNLIWRPWQRVVLVLAGVSVAFMEMNLFFNYKYAYYIFIYLWIIMFFVKILRGVIKTPELKPFLSSPRYNLMIVWWALVPSEKEKEIHKINNLLWLFGASVWCLSLLIFYKQSIFTRIWRQ